jgi:hypothetical protein
VSRSGATAEQTLVSKEGLEGQTTPLRRELWQIEDVEDRLEKGRWIVVTCAEGSHTLRWEMICEATALEGKLDKPTMQGATTVHAKLANIQFFLCRGQGFGQVI